LQDQWNDVKIVDSSDQNVKKYVFENDTSVAEAVLYKYPTYEERTVICCSTQSGCPVGCRFCGAGDSFIRSLTEDEIVSQPMRLLNDTGVDPATMGRLQIMFRCSTRSSSSPRFTACTKCTRRQRY
jgi:23S rRNA (adenine2503-C2)-methyltransferase